MPRLLKTTARMPACRARSWGAAEGGGGGGGGGEGEGCQRLTREMRSVQSAVQCQAHRPPHSHPPQHAGRTNHTHHSVLDVRILAAAGEPRQQQEHGRVVREALQGTVSGREQGLPGMLPAAIQQTSGCQDAVVSGGARLELPTHPAALPFARPIPQRHPPLPPAGLLCPAPHSRRRAAPAALGRKGCGDAACAHTSGRPGVSACCACCGRREHRAAWAGVQAGGAVVQQDAGLCRPLCPSCTAPHTRPTGTQPPRLSPRGHCSALFRQGGRNGRASDDDATCT